MKPLTFKEKLGYGLGDTASNFYLSFFGAFLLYYYTDVYHLNPAVVGTMLLMTKIIDAVSDPVMGLVSDRTSSRWGKFRPYLLWMAIPYGLCGYAMFLGPEFSETGRLIYAYITYSLVMLAYTAINVPYSALLGVISPSSAERTNVTTYRFFCAAAAGLMIGAFVTPLKNYLGGGDEALGFELTMALFALMSVILFLVTFATTRERIAPQPQNTSIREDFSALLKNRSWLLLVVSGILIITGTSVRATSAIYYLKYYIGDDGTPIFLIFDATALLLTLGALSQVVGVTLTHHLAKYFDKHHLIAALTCINAASLAVFYFIPAADFGIVLLVHGIGLFSFGPTIALLFAMYTDCGEYGEWRTGQRTTGLIISASMFSLKFGGAMGAALPGYILALYGFVANEAQSARSIHGIQLMFSAVPAVCYLSGGLLILFYTLSRKTMTHIEAELEIRRGELPQAV